MLISVSDNRTAVGVSRAVAMVLVRVKCQVRGAKSACGRWPPECASFVALSVLAVSQDTGSHTKLTGNTGPTKEPVLSPSNPAGPFFY